MSPDAFVQLSIMAAYYIMYGRLVNSYESVQTKAFLHGRTEVARSSTAEAAHFLHTWVNETDSTKVTKIKALRAAVRAHSHMTGEASRGMGCDRYLFALKCIFHKQNPGAPLPELFIDPSYQILNNSILSTSNCGNPSLRFFGFGPVVDSGFGIGYIIKDDAIQYMITSKHRQTTRFKHALEKYLEDIQDCLIELEIAASRQGYAASKLNCERQPSVEEPHYDFFGTEDFTISSDDSLSPVGRALRIT